MNKLNEEYQEKELLLFYLNKNSKDQFCIEMLNNVNKRIDMLKEILYQQDRVELIIIKDQNPLNQNIEYTDNIV